MVEVPRSSFIPKEPMGMTPDRVRRGRTFHVFGFIGTAFLAGSVIAAGVVFFMKSAAESHLTSVKNELSVQKDLFDAERVADVREFDRQLTAAEILLKNHVSPSRIFTALEEETKKKIQFTSFTLERTSPNEMLVTLVGKTEAFKILALQEMDFADHVLLKNIVFSEVATHDAEEQSEGPENASGANSNERGITFTLTGIISGDSIRYDGSRSSSLTSTTFIEEDGIIAAIDGEGGNGEVLGASIVNE